MFSFSLALIPLFVLSIHAHSIRLNTFPVTTEQKLALFGQLQQTVDQSNQLSVPSSQSDLSDDDQEQLTPISCYRVRPNIKNPVPNDSSKYFVCRNEFNYEIYTCPNGGVFDDSQKACLDLCQQNNPCMNQGQCIILPDLRLECVCRRDWTGERCETPLSSCAKNPCGPNAECRMLKTPDFDQDYVCICDNHRTYGKSCQRTVPNPCLNNMQQFHPFAFSRRAYINCDDEMIFFQPCNAMLYWNQEEKRCDRALPDILRAPFMNLKPKIKQIERIAMERPQLTQWRGNTDGVNEENIVVVMLQKPVTVEFTRWLETRIPEMQQIQQTNSPKLTQVTGSQKQWSNLGSSMPFTSSQRFVTPSTPMRVPNQQMPMKPFMETTTAAPSNVFRLQGFGNRPTANMGMDMSQTDSRTSSFFETTTTLAPDTSKFSLSGWKSTPQQEASPTMQLRSWKE